MRFNPLGDRARAKVAEHCLREAWQWLGECSHPDVIATRKAIEAAAEDLRLWCDGAELAEGLA